MNRLINTSLVIGLATVLFGCGGSSSPKDHNDDEDNPTVIDTSIAGKAIDGYLRYATVCLDLSSDGYCQPTEPFSLTDENGAFTFNVTKAQKSANPRWAEKNVVAFGGQDSDTGATFTGVVVAPYEKGAVSINVTPITTIVAKLKEQGSTQKEAEEKVAKLLGVKVENLDKDPIKEAKTNPKILKAALQLQKMVDLLVEAKKKDSSSSKDNAKLADEVLDALAQGLKESKLEGAKVSENLKDVVIKAKKKDGLKSVKNIENIETVVEVVANGIDEAIDENSFKQADKKDINKQIQIAAINIHHMKDEVKDKNQTELSDLKDKNIFDNLKMKKVTKDSIELEYLKNLLKGLKVTLDETTLDTLVADLKTAKADIPKLNYQTLKATLEKNSLKDKYKSLYEALSKELVKIDDKKDEADTTQTDASVNIKLPFSWYNIDGIHSSHGGGYILYYWYDSFKKDEVYSSGNMGVDLETKQHQADNEDDIDLVLVDGSWQDAPTSYKLSSDKKILTLDKYKADLVLKKEIDLSDKTKNVVIDGKVTEVAFSKGAKEFLISYKLNGNSYHLEEIAKTHGNMGNDYGQYYKSLKDFISAQSGKRWFDSEGHDDKRVGISFEKPYEGDMKDGVSGKLVKIINPHGSNQQISGSAGSWKIEKLPNSDNLALNLYYNTDILDSDDDDDEMKFYTMYDGKLYEGYKMTKSNDFKPFGHKAYNKVALDDLVNGFSKYVKEHGTNAKDDGISDGGKLVPVDPNPINVNGEKFTKEWLNGKTLYNVYLEKDVSKWELSTFTFTDKTWSAQKDGDSEKLENISYSITDEGYISFNAPWEGEQNKIEYIKIVSKTEDSMKLCWNDTKSNMTQCEDDEYFFYDIEKAKAFRDKNNAGIVANILTPELLDGKTFYYSLGLDSGSMLYGKKSFLSEAKINGEKIIIDSTGTIVSTKKYSSSYQLIDGKQQVETADGNLKFTLNTINNDAWYLKKEIDKNKDGNYKVVPYDAIWFLKKPTDFPDFTDSKQQEKFTKEMLTDKTFYIINKHADGGETCILEQSYTASTVSQKEWVYHSGKDWTAGCKEDFGDVTDLSYTIDNKGSIVWATEDKWFFKLDKVLSDKLIVTDPDGTFDMYLKKDTVLKILQQSNSKDLGVLLAGNTIYIAYNENSNKVIEKIEFSQDLKSAKVTVLTGLEAGSEETSAVSYENGKLYHDNHTKYDELISVTDKYILLKKDGNPNNADKFFFTQQAAKESLNN